MALLIRDGLVLTPEGAGVRAERGTVVVSGERIDRVVYGDERHRVPAGPEDRVIDAARRLVIPGLVDAHCHAYGALAPGLIDQMPLDTRALFLVATTAAWGERETWVTTLLCARRMLAHGTTTVLENVLQGLDATETAIQALLASGMRAVVGPMIADRPFHETLPGYLEGLPEPLRAETAAIPPPEARELVDRSLDLARRWDGASGRIRVCLSPSAPHRCTDALLTLVAEAAGDRDLPVHTHLLETRPQAVVARRLYGTTMVEHLRTLGLLRPGFSGAHSVWLTDGDVDLLGAAGAGISHNPLSNLYLGSGIARVPALLARGVAVGTGTDGPNCGATTSLFEIMKLAAVVHRLGEPDGARWVSAADAFRMATIGGARALGLHREIGSIEAGKRADLVLLDAEAPPFTPLNDPVRQLVYGETGGSVTTVLVNGDVVWDAGRPLMFDPVSLLAEARELGRRAAEAARPALARASRFEPYLRQAYHALIHEFAAGPPAS